MNRFCTKRLLWPEGFKLTTNALGLPVAQPIRPKRDGGHQGDRWGFDKPRYQREGRSPFRISKVNKKGL